LGCPNAFISLFYLATAGDGVMDDNPTADELEARHIEAGAYTRSLFSST